MIQPRIDFVVLDGWVDAHQRKLLQKQDVKGKSVFVLNNGLLLLAFSFLAATNLDHGGCFAIFFALSDH